MALYMLSSGGVSCAATADDALSQRRDSVLLNTNNNEIREAIRIFVREDAGRFVIADLDSLANNPNMIVRRRARDYQNQIRKLPAANLNYRLVGDGKYCWLIRHESSQNSPIAAELLLPETARCAPYSQNERN